MKRKRDQKEPTVVAATSKAKGKAKPQTPVPAAAKFNGQATHKTAAVDRPAKKAKSTPAASPATSILKTSSKTSHAKAGHTNATAQKPHVPGQPTTAHPKAAKPVKAARIPDTATTTGMMLGNVPTTIQIVAGSYDRTLHGVSATVVVGSGKRQPAEKKKDDSHGGIARAVQFADTFLFNAHTSAIRCLALSPPSIPIPGQGQKIMLATGSTDERINVYNLSAHPPAAATKSALAGAEEERALMASVVHRPVMAISENAKNRELGTLLHHSSTITRLVFPTRSKLLSGSEDSTIGVTRTRDWSLLSTIKAPIPKPGGGVSLPHRPSGDTAPPGGAPSGINDFAVHPSMKVMISVSRGERCMRLWNLVTGKKAGVLNFGKELLREVGEGRFSAGEGRQAVWGRSYGSTGTTTEDDDEFAIGFDRNVVVFGMDSRPRCKVLPDTRTKTHDFHYLEVVEAAAPSASASASASAEGGEGKKPFSLLAVATEDGRIVLCSTQQEDLIEPEQKQEEKDNAAAEANKRKASTEVQPLRRARTVGQIGGSAAGVTGRIKAFKILPVVETVPDESSSEGKSTRQQQVYYVVAASSTGALRVWRTTGDELRAAKEQSSKEEGTATQIGQLLGMYQTQDRITCVEAFVMIPRPEGLEDSEEEFDEDDEDSDDDEEDEE